MKRYISIFLVAILLLGCVLIDSPQAEAAKASESRTVAIVFDNSGSMYLDKRLEWCRATYAMEVFASMLNAGDTLQIYPMHPITVGGKKYTMESPLTITDASKASTIRDIYTEDAQGTPIESIDCAVKGLQAAKSNKKYLIVLTDGDVFYEGDSDTPLSTANTKKALDKRIQANAGRGMTVMYLGIGKNACMPDTAESEYFIKRKAADSADVLSTLTFMCNQVFGRDTLPKNHMSGKNIDFDISISKLIVFVQGENIANLKLSGNGVGKLVSSQQTKYSTAGAGGSYKDKCVADTSLQGMMVTYTDCAAGEYTIDFTGKNTSIEVYYEPDADLDFVFTDAAGNTVDPNALYEGDYKVSFGMKDAKTGKLITSDLLGNPKYQGSYSINGKEVPFNHEGSSGVVSVPLSMGDTFEAKLTVTYLSGYTISKDSTDFGWPKGGIQVAARPAGDMYLEVSGGETQYSLQDLEKGAPYIVKVFYKGEQLTGDALKSTTLTWDADASNALIKSEVADDHYTLSLHYKNSDAPQDTVCGDCRVPIVVSYAEKGSSEAKAQGAITYNIVDDFSPLRVEMYAPQDYIVIKELQESKPITALLKLNGQPLSAEDFAAVKLEVDCGGLEHTVTANPEDSSYTIQLLPKEGIEEGDYKIQVNAVYTDHIGRETATENAVYITLSNTSLLVKWLIRLGLLILFLLLILWIMRRRVMPKKVVTTPRNSSLTIGATTYETNVSYPTKLSGKNLAVLCRKGSITCGIKMKGKPGSDSYLSKPTKNRSIEVNPKDISVQNGGGATVTEANINGNRFAIDPATHKFAPVQQNQKPITLKNGAPIKWSGTVLDNGRKKNFSVTTKLEFKK